MASGTIGAEEVRLKDRWNENCIVYTRRSRKVSTSKHDSAKVDDVARKNEASQNGNGTCTPTGLADDCNTVIPPLNSPAKDADLQLPNSQSIPVNVSDSQQQQHLPDSQSSPARNAEPEHQHQLQSSPANSEGSGHQQQPNSLRIELVSDDSSRQEGVLPNGHGVVLENGSASARDVITLVDEEVNIRLSAERTKQHVKELKRKLLSNLDHVRNLARKLDDKEAQLIGVNGGLSSSGDGGAGGLITGDGGQSLSQYSTSDGLRVNSQGFSAGLNGSRPFRHLSVSVIDNNHDIVEILDREKRTPKANQFYQNSDFICGKEKLPPAESNKKHKSNGRKKLAGGGVSEIDKHIYKRCATLLQQLMKHKHGWVFNVPVDVKALCLHDYYDIVKHPMDLGTVKNRLNKNWYKSPLEFAEDVRLTFHNAMTYNPEGQDVHSMAVQLFSLFEEKWIEIEGDYNSKLRYEAAYGMGLRNPTSRQALMPLSVSQPPAYQGMKHLDKSESFTVPVVQKQKPVYSAPIGRTPAPKKPKAKDPDKRDMTFEEKQRLSTKLQALPPEKLDNIVQIIKKRNSTLNQNDDEIEVDIDSVDAETLWELDRFVTNYRKNLSKHKRRAELALERAEAQKKSGPTIPGVAAMEMVADGTGDVAGKQADDASESSSSSSDSGSSSSDSDSDSSSGSDGGA